VKDPFAAQNAEAVRRGEAQARLVFETYLKEGPDAEGLTEAETNMHAWLRERLTSLGYEAPGQERPDA